jgi:hypothetical protein
MDLRLQVRETQIQICDVNIRRAKVADTNEGGWHRHA